MRSGHALAAPAGLHPGRPGWPRSQEAFPSMLSGRALATPERFAGERGALGQRFELGPLDGRADADLVPVLGEAAIYASDQVLLADDAGEVLNPPGDELRVLDYIGGLRDDPGDQDLA